MTCLATPAPLDASPVATPDVSRLAAAEHDRSRLTAVPDDASLLSPRDLAATRACRWCRGPIPAAARRDALTCSKRCRQARHRFGTAVGRPTVAAAGDRDSLRLAYADPPYPGKAHLYRGHPDYAGEVDQAALIRRLSTFDGWALSTSAEALPSVLASCPPGARVAAWFRGERPNAQAMRPQNAWEPVVYYGGRLLKPSSSSARRVDALVYHAHPRTTDPLRVVGAKPATFARWMFDLLGALPGDELDDLFPGSRGIERAWAVYTNQSTT